MPFNTNIVMVTIFKTLFDKVIFYSYGKLEPLIIINLTFALILLAVLLYFLLLRNYKN